MVYVCLQNMLKGKEMNTALYKYINEQQTKNKKNMYICYCLETIERHQFAKIEKHSTSICMISIRQWHITKQLGTRQNLKQIKPLCTIHCYLFNTVFGVCKRSMLDNVRQCSTYVQYNESLFYGRCKHTQNNGEFSSMKQTVFNRSKRFMF